MTGCRRCGHYRGGHSEHCPEVFEGKERDFAVMMWDEGFADGRSGWGRAFDDPSYNLGFLRGESALEEAQNGSSWVT